MALKPNASFRLVFYLTSHLHGLAMTCTDFGRAQICRQVDASFFTVWPPNASQRKLTTTHTTCCSLCELAN